jgi:hypothetical protein
MRIVKKETPLRGKAEVQQTPVGKVGRTAHPMTDWQFAIELTDARKGDMK